MPQIFRTESIRQGIRVARIARPSMRVAFDVRLRCVGLDDAAFCPTDGSGTMNARARAYITAAEKMSEMLAILGWDNTGSGKFRRRRFSEESRFVSFKGIDSAQQQ